MRAMSVAELYRQYAGMVYSVSLKGMRDRQAAEDVSQQVFMNVFRSLDGFRNQCQLKTWIYQITLNECYQHRLKEKRERRKVEAFVGSAPRSRDDAPHWDDRILVRRVLKLADPKTRKALDLIYREGLTHAQIADACRTSRVTVTKRLNRFRAAVATTFPEN